MKQIKTNEMLGDSLQLSSDSFTKVDLWKGYNNDWLVLAELDLYDEKMKDLKQISNIYED